MSISIVSSNPNPNNSLWGLIVAAGRGTRAGQGAPKQYHALAGRRVIDWSVDALLQTPQLQGLMLVVAAEDAAWQQSDWASDERVKTTIGGTERSDSVIAGLRALQKDCGAADADRVLVHDAARPAVSSDDIQVLIERVASDPNGGLLAAPVRDTVKRAGTASRVGETVARDGLWQAMTPQLFPLGSLLAALSKSADTAPTDESQAMERAGWQPLLVPGSPQNLKYTYQQDLLWLTGILAGKNRGGV